MMQSGTFSSQRGFTLIELMVAMVIGLVLMAGIYSNFIMQSSVQSMQSDVTERLGDLYLASHIMQGDLRTSVAATTTTPRPSDLGTGGRYNTVDGCAGPAKTVSLPSGYPTSFPYLPYWDATSLTLTYQDQDGDSGIFQYQRTATDRIYWLSPDPCVYQFQELIRDMDTSSGMVATSSGTGASRIHEVTLKSSYQDKDHNSQTLELSFKIWPRN